MSETEINLLTALQNYKAKQLKDYEYRLYYNKETGNCIEIRCVESNIKDNADYITVDKELVTHLNFKKIFILNGTIQPKQKTFRWAKLIRKYNNGEYRTIKNSCMFLVNDTYVGETDYWSVTNEHLN
jgi:hypothetical protein